MITDLRSTNGVEVQRRRIRPTATLADGDHIRIGGHEFIFEIRVALSVASAPAGERKNFARISRPSDKRAARNLMESAEGADPNRDSLTIPSSGQLRAAKESRHECQHPQRRDPSRHERQEVSKVRIAAGVVLGTVGLSIAGSLMPAVASADPYIPWSGPLHPFRHYAADVIAPRLGP